ncbi:MAG: CPBP family intramembrane glutamic endopeptidase [Phycisphaerales bacterium]
MDPPFQPQPGDSLQPAEDWRRLNARRRGHAFIAWIGIVAMCAFAILMQQIAANAVSADDEDDPLGVLFMQMQARHVVASGDWLQGDRREALYEQSEGLLNIGSVDQRQRFVILAGELAGVEEARRVLAELEAELADPPRGDPPELSETQADVQGLLQALYGPAASVDGPNQGSIRLTEDQRELLIQRLGWFGRLALAPPEAQGQADRKSVLAPAYRVSIVLISALTLGLLVAFAGFLGLVVMGVLTLVGKVRSGLVAGAGAHGIYAETFAIWMILFFGLQVVAELIASLPGMQDHHLIIGAGAFFVSLGVLVWPVVRGVPWRQVRLDIGWTFGRQPGLEPIFGVVGYAMTLPLFFLGVVVFFLFMFVQTALAGPQPTFAPSGGPAHPVIFDLAHGQWWATVQVLFLAVVAAPIVEETMFRGVLYRHLRDASARTGLVLSVLLSTLINTFVFAVIHPQGWVAMPALMALACGFTLMREWRGTIVPSMIMHAVSNGLVMTFLILLVAD